MFHKHVELSQFLYLMFRCMEGVIRSDDTTRPRFLSLHNTGWYLIVLECTLHENPLQV